MKISREKLVQAVDDAIRAHRADYDRRLAAYEANQVERQAEWLELHRADWDAAALRIRRQLKKDEPITIKDLPCRAGHGTYPEVYDKHSSFDGVRHPGKFHEDRELASMRKALELITDDDDDGLTLAGMERVGIRRDALRTVYALAAKA